MRHETLTAGGELVIPAGALVRVLSGRAKVRIEPLEARLVPAQADRPPPLALYVPSEGQARGRRQRQKRRARLDNRPDRGQNGP